MQKVFAFILLLAFSGQTFSQGFYYIDYAINKAEYVKKCVNKLRPQLHCDGKCQLMKKIQEQERKERQQAPEMKLAAKAEALSSRSFFTAGLQRSILHNAFTYSYYNYSLPADRAFSYFHPPDISFVIA